MCGIFGYLGEFKEDLSGFLLKKLLSLEYRGYDSAGISILTNNRFKIFKEVGEIKNLQRKISDKKIPGWLGVGHTRWATHGGVTVKNAHPHTDCTGRIVVVHNGIIENYARIKKWLITKGHKFNSETDTEVFAHLVEEVLKSGKSFRKAVRASFNKIVGLSAVVVLSSDGEMVGFKRGSPLVVGIGKEGSYYLSSDIPSLASETEDIVLIDEDEGVLLSKSGIRIISAKRGREKTPKVSKVTMEDVKVDLGGYPHYLLKEIYEQPEVVARVSENGKKDILEIAEMIRKAFGTYFTACGSAAYSCIAATYFFSEIAHRHVNFTVGSEFPYFGDFLVKDSLLIAASQSGETMDTLEAVRAAKKHKSKVLAIVNVPGSTLTRLADKTFLLKAGPERAVVTTKAYVAKLSTFLLLAYSLANRLDEGIKVLKITSKKMSEMLQGNLEKKVKNLAEKLVRKNNIYLIGRGVNLATCLEGALKLKETSYIHSEGFPGGELKHGVIALIEKGTPCIVIVANDKAKGSVISNAMELASRGGYIIGISPKKEKVFDYWIKVPNIPAASPIVSVVPLQLLAYHLSILKGYNPDKPRNLAKSVTVK